MRSRRAGDVAVVVRTEHLSRTEAVAACRAALETLAARADRFQLDVPWDNAGAWPSDVVAAAALLVPRRQRYESTGWVTPVDDERWRSFVLVAPYAYSADAWTREGRPVADVDDEGSSIVLHVPAEEVDQLAATVAPARLEPLRSQRWRRRRR